jgi:O-methyltransferase
MVSNFKMIHYLAVLRLDCDMYGSTIEVLNALYGKLSVGGYCIVDDYSSIPECKKAVDDYISQNRLKVKKHEIDWTGIYWRKE